MAAAASTDAALSRSSAEAVQATTAAVVTVSRAESAAPPKSDGATPEAAAGAGLGGSTGGASGSGGAADTATGAADGTEAPTTSDAPGSAVAPIEKLGFCQGCLLRIQGCRDNTRYLEAKDASAPSSSAEAADACGLCLGLLENGAAASRQQLRQKLQNPEFEGNTYDLSITLPLLCSVRHQVLLCNLRAILSASGQEGAEPDCIPLRDVLSWLCGEELSKLGLSPEAASGDKEAGSSCIMVAMMCLYEGLDNSELERLQKGKAGRGKNAKRRRVEMAPVLSEKSVQTALENLTPTDCLSALGGRTLIERLGRVRGCAATSVDFSRASIFLKGHYLKLSRVVPQSPWFIDGQRRGESSVEEHILGPTNRVFGATKAGGFHAEGREDIDVRMLGGGRTFVVEVQGAKRISITATEVEAAINAAGDVVQVRQLSLCKPAAMAQLQRDAEDHRKTYVCVCWSRRPIAEKDLESLHAIKDLEVAQKTPIRVLHRRNLAIRPKTLHWIKAELINAHYFTARLSTQAGMYIKEFVHGDLGRTCPSLKSLLGSQVEILQLDVEGLEEDI